MLLIARDNRSGDTHVHYIPDGGHVRTLGYDVERMGEAVFVHLPTHSLKVEGGTSVNLTDIVLTVLPVEDIFRAVDDPERVVHDLERRTFDESISLRTRRVLRLYAALVGLKAFDVAPGSVKDSLILTASRLTGLTPEEILSDRRTVIKRLEEEIKKTLAEMDEKELTETVLLIEEIRRPF